MNKLIDKILLEWSYRVHDGMPNRKNPLHLVQLEETLNELKIPRKVSEKILKNLRQIEEDDIVKNKKSDNTYVVKKHNPNTQNLIKKNASDKEIEKAKKGEKTTTSKGVDKQKEVDEYVNMVLDELVEDLAKGRSSGIAGEFKFESLEDIKKMLDFYNDNKGNLHNVQHEKKYEVNDETVDRIWDGLQERSVKMGKSKDYLTNKIMNKGAPPSKYKTPERAKKVLKHFLETGGVSIITGERIPFSRMQLDHAVSLSNGGKDEPENWHWIESRYNQIKGALEDERLIEYLKEVKEQDPGMFKLDKVKDNIKNLTKYGLQNFFSNSFSTGDDAGLTEESLKEFPKPVLQAIAVGLNKSQGWGEGEQSVKRYGSVKDKNPDSPTFGRALTRRDSKTGNRKVIPPSPKSNLKIYKKLNDGQELTDEEKQKIEKEKATWGVDWDSKTNTGSKPKFAGEVEYKGKKMSSTTLVKWKNPRGKVLEVPAGWVLAYEDADVRESGGADLPQEDLIDNIIDGFKRAGMPLLTKQEEGIINNAVAEERKKLSSFKKEMSDLKKQLASAETEEEKEIVRKKIDALYKKTKFDKAQAE